MIQETLQPGFLPRGLEWIEALELVILAGLIFQVGRLSILAAKPHCCTQLEAWANAIDKWIRDLEKYLDDPETGSGLKTTLSQMQQVICDHRRHLNGEENVPIDEWPSWCDTDPIPPPRPPCKWGDCPE